MKIILGQILILVFLVVSSTTSMGADQLPLSESISIKADSLQQNGGNNRYLASGNVVINWSGMNLTSDTAVYDAEAKLLVATGNVTMTKGDDVLKGTRFSVNVESGKTELEQGSLEIRKGNIHFTGEKIVRENERRLVLSNTELTTCDLPDPSWKFGAEKLDVNLLGYATGRNIIFYVKDVPVLYLPWIAFPVVRDRQSGLLFPRFGYSSSRGVQITVPAYLVIAPNQDLQFDLDLQAKRGVGTGIQYRYARKRGSEGGINSYLIYDLKDSSWRGQLTQKHTEIFSDSMNVRSSVSLTTDRRFLNDFGEKNGDYNRQSNESSVNFLKTWQNFAFTSLARYSDNLYSDSNKATVQKLPEIGVAAVRQPLFNIPVYFDMDSNITSLYRESGTRGQRFTAFPRLSLPASLAGSLNGTFFAGIHVLAYTTESDSKTIEPHSFDGQIVPELGGRFSVPLQRVYDVKIGALEKLRHEIVPEVRYLYTFSRNQKDLPFYDFDDRVVGQSNISWSLTNRFGGRFRRGEVTEYIDMMSVTLSQGYNVSGSRRNLLTLVDDNRSFDDVSIESESWLHNNARLIFDSRYNLHDNRISSAAPGFELDDKRGTTVGLSYRMARHNVEYAEMRFSTKYMNPWTLGYSSRYSFDRSGFLEAVYSAEYVQKCWSVTFIFRDRPGNKTGTINFNLAGLMGN